MMKKYFENKCRYIWIVTIKDIIFDLSNRSNMKKTRYLLKFTRANGTTVTHATLAYFPDEAIATGQRVAPMIKCTFNGLVF